MRFVLICFYFLQTTQAFCPAMFSEADNNFCYVEFTNRPDNILKEEAPYWKYKDLTQYRRTERVWIPAKKEISSGLYRVIDKSYNYGDVVEFNFPASMRRNLSKHVNFTSDVKNVRLTKEMQDCVAVVNSDVFALSNCQTEGIWSMFFYENRNTFCENFDLICSPAAKKFYCHCLSQHTLGYFCREYCEGTITTGLDCSTCDSSFASYPEPQLTLKINSKKIFLTVSNYLKLQLLTETIPAVCYVNTKPRVYNPIMDSNPYVQFVFNLVKEKQNDRIYELLMVEGLVLGQYKCKGFVYPDLHIVESNTVYYRPKNSADVIFVAVTSVEFSAVSNPFLQIASEVSSKFQYPFEVSVISIENGNAVIHLSGRTGDYYDDVNAAYADVKVVYPNVLNSEYCMSYTMTYNEDQEIFWDFTNLGQTVISSPLCIDDSGNVVTAECIGDVVLGAKWSFNFDENNVNCRQSYGGTTDELTGLLDSNLPASDLTNNLLDSVKYNEGFQTYDIYLIGKILQKIANANESFALPNFAQILSRLMDFDSEMLKNSQKSFNATDLILGSLDEAMINYANNFMEAEEVATTKNLNLHLYKMAGHNANAVFYYANGSSKIFNSARVTEILEDEFIAAIFLPQNVFNEVLEKEINKKDLSLVSAIYRKDTLFNNNNDLKKTYRVTGWIPNVIITDFQAQLLEAPVTVVVKPYRKYRQTHSCSFWDFGIGDNYLSLNGFWERESTAKKLGKYYLCEYWHMTHYGLLLDLPSNDTLNIISYVTSGVSILGLVLIFLTAILSKNWRESPSSKIALSSSFTLVIQMIVLSFSKIVDSYDEETTCIIIGAVLHYTVISQFLWMLIVGVFQYRRFILVFVSPSPFLLVICVIAGWMLPLFPVVCILIFSLRSYISDEYCYLTGSGLYLGVFLPIGVILTMNVLVYARIFGKFCCSEKIECHGGRESKTKLYLRLAIFLFFMMGLTWIFGLLNGFLKVEYLSYLFCVTACLQGGVMFWFYVVLNKDASNSWKGVIARCFPRMF